VNWENDVNIISRPALRRAQQAHSDAAEWLEKMEKGV
jgi:hypothetical protein